MSELLTPSHAEWWRVKSMYSSFFDGESKKILNYPIRNLSGAGNAHLNNSFFQLIEKIHNQEVQATVLDVKYLQRAVNSAINLAFSNVFIDSQMKRNEFGIFPENSLRLLENNPDLILLIIVDGLTKLSVTDVDGTKKVTTERLLFDDVDELVREWIENTILKLAEEGKLDSALGRLPAEIVQKNYSFAHYKEEMSKRVNSMIQDVDGTTKLLDFTKEFYDVYIGLSERLESDGEKMYHLSKNIYSGGKFTKVPAAAIDDNSELKKLFEHPNVFNYPLTIIRDHNNDEVEEIKEDLRNFSTLNGANISEYPFVFLKSATLSKNIFGTYKAKMMSDGWFLGALKWWYEEKTPSEVISKTLAQNYFSFLRSLSKDIFENSRLTNTIGEEFENALDPDKVKPIFDFIVFDKIVAAKKEFFDNLAKETSDADDTPGELTPEEIEKGLRGQLDTFEKGKPPELPEGPSEEDIANRQKYFKQCALMLNMPELRDSYQQKLKQRYAGKLPFGGRFTTLHAKDEEQEAMLTSLVSSQNEQLLFELESWKVSKLVPKVRLFKVFHDHEKGEKEVEFIFDRSSNIRDTFMNPDVFDKGTGVGLKNFSFEFNGTTPATARNDITANLTLFFQSFQDFLRTRQGYDDKYRYVDLVIQPTPDKKGQYAGIDIQSDRQYEPQFYRIRADVGYVLPTEADGFSREEIEAIRVSNKSFFLNMVDHDISFGKDGTVEIKISYRAYLESLLKHPRLDALASPELIAKRIENAKTFSEQVQKRECSVDQIKELQVTLAAQEEIILKQSLSSIITRLKNRGVIYKVLIDKKDKEHFLKKGFFRKCDLERTTADDGSNGADVKLVLNSELPESSEDFGFIDSANRSVQFFYFGDLLYTILDCVYDANDNVRAGTGYDRNSIILGSFEFEPFQQISAGSKVYNIADLPISVDFFSRWFVDNVMSQKSTRKTFPVMNFIRSLSNYLIKPSIIENCVNRKLETRLRFQTTQITTFEPGGVNPLKDWYNLANRNEPIISLDVENLRTYGVLPLRGGPENDANSNFKDFHTFVVLSAIGSTLTYAGNGNYGEDIERGRFHVHVGQNAGLVKTLSLSKSDMQYIREARFFQNGIDGLLQLSAVYVANLEMFGNTLFYPGMEFFFNPFGIGGENFDPTVAGSNANKLGIGGYHTITSVKSSITPGKFTTSISAQQYYSGDGSGNPNIVKKKNADRKANSIDSYTPEDPNNEQGFANCKTAILNAQNYDFEEGSASSSVNSNNSTVAPVEEASPEEVVDEIIGARSEPTSEEITDEIIGARSEPTPEEIVDEIFGPTSEVADGDTSTITGESLDESPTVSRTYSGKLKTVISSQTTTSSTGGQFSQQFTERGGKFTEMSDGTVYFQGINGNGTLGDKTLVEDHNRIIEQ